MRKGTAHEDQSSLAATHQFSLAVVAEHGCAEQCPGDGIVPLGIQ